MSQSVWTIAEMSHDPTFEPNPHLPTSVYHYDLKNQFGSTEYGVICLIDLLPFMNMHGHESPHLLIGVPLVRPSMLDPLTPTLTYFVTKAKKAFPHSLTREDYFEIAIDAFTEMRVPDFSHYSLPMYRDFMQDLTTNNVLFARFCDAVNMKSGGRVRIEPADEADFNLKPIPPAMRWMYVIGPGQALKVVLHPILPFLEDIPPRRNAEDNPSGEENGE